MTPHAETLRAPLSWWVAVVAFAAVCGWIVLVATTTPAAIAAGLIAFAALAFGLWKWGSMRITVDDSGIRAGRAFLEPQFTGTPEALGSAEYRLRLGTEADARALLVTRPWAQRGVLVPIDDPQDPTPYWILGTDEPQRLAKAITTMRTDAQSKGRI